MLYDFILFFHFILLISRVAFFSYISWSFSSYPFFILFPYSLTLYYQPCLLIRNLVAAPITLNKNLLHVSDNPNVTRKWTKNSLKVLLFFSLFNTSFSSLMMIHRNAILNIWFFCKFDHLKTRYPYLKYINA